MLKKLIYLLMAFALLPAYANEENLATNSSGFQPFAGRVVGKKVRLRTQPSLEAHVVRETLNGEMVGVTGEDDEYYAVTPSKGTKGYIFRTFVLDGVVEGERVNIRLYPDIEAPVIGQLNTGDQVRTVVSEINNKWLEIDLPNSCNFYIAKEYVEKAGPIEMIAQLEKRHHEATHHLSSAFLFAQSEIQKPFEQIDLDSINEKFDLLVKDYTDLPDIGEHAKEINTVMQDIYVQKKIGFLESKAESRPAMVEIDPNHLDRLAKLGFELKPFQQTDVQDIAEAATRTMGLASTFSDKEVTDKMLLWEPLEESLFHLWTAASGEESSLEEFYHEEELNATVFTGIIEPYNRPVKNRPGDYLLKCENLPSAYLYSTRVNLDKLIGKKVTIKASPRPNNNFAFPAYFVLSIE